MIENDRKTLHPMDVVDSKMVALSLSSMATTLEQIQRSVLALERQHDVTITAIGEAKGAANLAGGIASAAREEIEIVRQTCDRIENAVGMLAQSVQGLEEASRSLIETVFPERERSSDVELADVVPIRRRNVMTGE